MVRIFIALSTLVWGINAFGFGSPPLRISSGSITGVYFPISSAIAKMIQHRQGYDVTVLQTAGSIDNIQRLLKGDTDLALTAADNLYSAYNQQPPFQNQSAGKSLRVIASIYPELLHIIVHKKCLLSKYRILLPGVLARCSLNLGPANSGTLEHALMVLSELKLAPKNTTKYDFETATEKIMAGEIDGGFFTVGIQSLTITSLMNSGDYVLLSLPGTVEQKIRLKYPYLTIQNILSNTYLHQPYAVSTLAIYAQLATTSYLSKSMVREVIETLMADIHELRAAHACGRNFSLQSALDGINIPIHDGAKEFFVKQGILSSIDGSKGNTEGGRVP